MLDGFYEYHVTEFVARNVKPGMQVMDIGANFGYFTLLMADLVGPTGKVYAFEPNPNVATLLGYSLRANNFTSRAVVDYRAISDCAGSATFLIPAFALTNAHIIDPIDPAQIGSSPDLMHLTVETVALDDLRCEGINFIKADIEGAEEKLWHGGKSFFARNPDLLCVLEFNCNRCASPRATLEDVGRIFRLRCLDESSYVRDVTINEMLDSEFDWMLVLSQHEEVD
jgi:FkbM family methyltransferase